MITAQPASNSPAAQPQSSEVEAHDPAVLASTRALLDACGNPEEMARAVVAAVERNAEWRGRRCLNLLAPEAPTSPTVRHLLASEIGTRAAEGHIGAVNRWFAGTKHIDEVEALCVELLKQAFHARYADHRLVASMIGNLAVYTALTAPGDIIMSLPQPVGGIPATGQTARRAFAASRSWMCRWTRSSWRWISTSSPRRRAWSARRWSRSAPR